MPVPEPKPGESERDFISRCISKLHDTDPDRPEKQRIAMCYSQWRRDEESTEDDDNWLVPFRFRRALG